MRQHRSAATRYRLGAAFCVLTLFFCAAAASDDKSPARHIGFSILEDYDKVEDLADVAQDFALFRELGVTTWRGSFGWDE